MNGPFYEPKLIEYRGSVIIGDRHCPTWQVEPFTGWRRPLNLLPARWFKSRWQRVLYRMPDGRWVCSYETLAGIMKETGG